MTEVDVGTPLRAEDPFGAVHCEEHNRRECSKRRQSDGQRCHGSAIDGLAACRKHAGTRTDEAKAKGQAALKAQRFRDVAPSEYVDPGDVLLWSVTLARIDLADYRAELRSRPEDNPAGDAELDRLARLIDQAGRMSKMALDAKVDERRLRVHEALGDRLTAFVRALLQALGHDPNDPEVQQIARRQLELIAGAA